MPLLMTSKRREKIQTTDLTIQKVEKKKEEPREEYSFVSREILCHKNT